MQGCDISPFLCFVDPENGRCSCTIQGLHPLLPQSRTLEYHCILHQQEEIYMHGGSWEQCITPLALSELKCFDSWITKLTSNYPGSPPSVVSTVVLSCTKSTLLLKLKWSPKWQECAFCRFRNPNIFSLLSSFFLDCMSQFFITYERLKVLFWAGTQQPAKFYSYSILSLWYGSSDQDHAILELQCDYTVELMDHTRKNFFLPRLAKSLALILFDYSVYIALQQ